MTPADDALLGYLKTHVALTPEPPEGYTYSGAADYILDRGAAFESRTLDREQRAYVRTLGTHWKLRECFHNAQRLADAHERLTYCEGYAVSATGFPVHHAWCVLDESHVIDLTWRTHVFTPRARRIRGVIPEGWSYVGCRFPAEPRAHLRRAAKLGVWTSYLDNYAERYPLYKEPRRKPREVDHALRAVMRTIANEDAFR